MADESKPAPAERDEEFHPGGEDARRKLQVNEIVTETRRYEAPRTVALPGIMPHKTQTGERKALDDLMDSPDCADASLSVERYWPIADERGKRVPHGTLVRDLPVMPLENLRIEIKRMWGGGNYRVFVMDKNTGERMEKYKALTFGISPQECPPKTELSTSSDEEGGDEEQDLAKRERRMRYEKRRMEMEAEMARSKREAEHERITLERLHSGNNGGTGQVELLMEFLKQERASSEQRQAQERRDSEERSRRDKEESDRRAKESDERSRRDKEEADRRAKEQYDAMLVTMKEMIASVRDMSKSSDRPDSGVAMIQALAPVLAPKPDNNVQMIAEVIKAGQVTQAQMAELRLKQEGREERGWAQERTQLYGLLLQNRDNPSGMKDVLQIMGEMKRQTREEIEFAHGLASDETGGEEIYNPKIGIMGNIVNGLGQLVKEAARNPELISLVMRLFGTRNPTRDQMMTAAGRLAQSQTPVLLTPPAVAPRLQAPIPQVVGPGALYTPPPLNNPVAVPQVASGSDPSIPSAPSGTAPESVQQQIQAATELEGETTGMTVPNISEETPEQRLRAFVTDSIKICSDDVQDKREAREWWHDADQWWSAEFKKTLLELPDDQQRVELIRQKCDPAHWERLLGLLRQDGTGTETARFYEGLRLFLDENRKRAAAANPPPPRIQAPPSPPPSAAPTTPTAQA